MSTYYSGKEFILDLSRQYDDPRDENFINSFGTSLTEIFYSYTFQSSDIEENLNNVSITYVKNIKNILDSINYSYYYVGYSFKIKNINNVNNFLLNVDNYVSIKFFKYQSSYCLQNFYNPFYYVKSFTPNYYVEVIEPSSLYTEKYCPQIFIDQINDLQIFTEDIFPIESTLYLQIEYKNAITNFDLFEIGFHSQANASNKLEVTR